MLLDYNSGTSNHMIGMSSLFTYHICSGKDKVRIVDSSLCFVVGHENILAIPDIHLSSVLHGPNFTLNLLSISYITEF